VRLSRSRNSARVNAKVSSNERMELTAPLGGRVGDGGVDAAASRAFARRRRSSSAVLGGRSE
jgi:hypothetical protein